MDTQVMSEMDDSMKKCIEKMRSELSSIRTGRASMALMEGIKVDYYGSQMAVNQVATIAIPEPRTIEIKPWDAGAIPAIEKGIHASGLGLTPMNDGKLIRLTIPSLTQERRQDMIKLTRKHAEDFRVSIRNARREAIEKIKKLQKDKKLAEDDARTREQEVQKLTNGYIQKVEGIVSAKEKEITAV